MSALTLSAPKVVTPAVVVTSVNVERIVDLPKQRIVRAFLKELQQPLVLWSDEAYDAIGNWTQEQAEARILEILG